MNTKIIEALNNEKYEDAAQIFFQTPNFNYETSNPIFKLNYFEFSNTKDKNPVFYRLLLNYISLINLIYDKKIQNFHEIVSKFCSKFTYEEKNKVVKFILMIKSSTEVYNFIFQNDKNVFQNNDDVDLKFWNNNDKIALGYTFQELGKIFLTDYVIGYDKGKE